MINERTDKLKDSIEETQKEIENLQVVIQAVENLRKDNSDFEIKYELNNLINSFDNKIKFLEDIKDSDEKTLNLFN